VPTGIIGSVSPSVSFAQVKKVSDYIKWSMTNQVENNIKLVENASDQTIACSHIGFLTSTGAHLYSLSIGSFYNSEVGLD
jgi:catabolite regulation protein CreA